MRELGMVFKNKGEEFVLVDISSRGKMTILNRHDFTQRPRRLTNAGKLALTSMATGEKDMELVKRYQENQKKVISKFENIAVGTKLLGSDNKEYAFVKKTSKTRVKIQDPKTLSFYTAPMSFCKKILTEGGEMNDSIRKAL